MANRIYRAGDVALHVPSGFIVRISGQSTFKIRRYPTHYRVNAKWPDNPGKVPWPEPRWVPASELAEAPLALAKAPEK